MAKSENQKQKLLFLADYFEKYTDEENPVTVAELISALEKECISAERKSIYSDIETLIDFGYDIVSERNGRKTGYFLASREFETAELKLLVDAVQSSKFLSVKKSLELIKKLETLTSQNIAKTLRREMFVSGRVKAMNESVYYNIDAIHSAIFQGKKIGFLYFNYNKDKEKVLRRGGEEYVVSPFSLIFEDENYYLLAYDSEAGLLKHYRVDKMDKIKIKNEDREGLEIFGKTDVAENAKMLFGMFGGREELVTIRFENNLAGAVIDRFGKSVAIRNADDDGFYITTRVKVSPQFFGWLSSFGKDAKIVSPDSVRAEYLSHIKAILE